MTTRYVRCYWYVKQTSGPEKLRRRDLCFMGHNREAAVPRRHLALPSEDVGAHSALGDKLLGVLED